MLKDIIESMIIGYLISETKNLPMTRHFNISNFEGSGFSP